MIDPNARIDPGKLEQLGTAAALLYCDCGTPLSQAVCQVVKDIALTTEHVKRILEFANVKAYLTLYEKADPDSIGDGSWMKYISFNGAPAEFGTIMDTLDSASTPEEVGMPSREDYEQEPLHYKAASFASTLPEPAMQKEASLELEDEMPRVSLDTLYSNLGSAISKVDSDILKFANLVPDTEADFLKEAKQAVIHGYSLGDIRKVASSAPDQHLDRTLVNLATAMDAFWDENMIRGSFEKVSALQPVKDHPLAEKWALRKEAKRQFDLAQATKRILREKRAHVLSVIRENYDG
jgi:hypothetical protein